MKKIIFSLILVITVIFSCMCPAFAAVSSAWVLNKDAESITHTGTNYFPVYNVKSYHFLATNKYTAELEFADEATREEYGGGYISTYYETADIIEVVFNNGENGTTLYVSEAYMSEFQKLRDGEGAIYEVENGYGMVTVLSREDYLNCTGVSTGSFSNVSDNNFEWYDLFAVNEKGFACTIGAVVREKRTGDFYILKFSDYDSSYFYADGTFARYKRVSLYEITDSEVVYTINGLIEARPDDELEWLVGNEPSETAKMISAIVFFVAIPVGIIIFCTIMLIRAKKKMYRCPLIILMSASAVLILSAITILA